MLAIFTASMLIACGNSKKNSSQIENISLSGSTSMEKTIGGLSEAFMIEHPDISITYEPTGSSAGITSVLENTADIGLSSRELKPSETGITPIVVAYDGIIIIVHKDNPIKNLTTDKVKSLFNGEVTNWQDVGGLDLPVVPIGREAGAGTRDGFESVLGLADTAAYQQELISTGAILAGVSSNKNAIGYISFASAKNNVNVVSLDEVAPSKETILDGSYTLRRSFLLLVNDNTQLSVPAKAFLEFATSPEANDIISSTGVIPVNIGDTNEK